MKVYIFGYNGNMAGRYKAILNYLGHEHSGHDVKGGGGSFSLKDADRIIVATPTKNHASDIRDCLNFNIPILCEKPITKDRLGLCELLSAVEEKRGKLAMVSQYDYLDDKEASGPTEYNYFKHGGDGLAWDCINIIWNARGDVKLGETSPIWNCKLNGKKLNLGDMDVAYIKMLSDWLAEPKCMIDRIWSAHEKCRGLECKISS